LDLDFACSEDQTVSSLITDWNASLEQNKIIIEEANQQLKAKLDAKEIDPKQFLIGWQPVPQFLRSPGLQWSKWFLRSWGWSLLSRQSDAQASLPYDHYDMVQARAKVAKMTAEDNIHPGLIINFDQLWRASWQFGGKLLYKAREHAGQRVARRKAPKRTEKKLHSVKGARRSITVTCFNLVHTMHVTNIAMADAQRLLFISGSGYKFVDCLGLGLRY